MVPSKINSGMRTQNKEDGGDKTATVRVRSECLLPQHANMTAYQSSAADQRGPRRGGTKTRRTNCWPCSSPILIIMCLNIVTNLALRFEHLQFFPSGAQKAPAVTTTTCCPEFTTGIIQTGGPRPVYKLKRTQQL